MFHYYFFKKNLFLLAENNINFASSNEDNSLYFLLIVSLYCIAFCIFCLLNTYSSEYISFIPRLF